MFVVDNLGDGFGHAAHENAGLCLNKCDVAAPLGGGGCEFKADEATADDDDIFAGLESFAQIQRVFVVAKGEREFTSRQSQCSGFGSRGQQEF